MNHANLYAVVAVSLVLVGCEQVQGLVPRSPDAQGRYQFERDDQGRLFRLDTVSGELSVVSDAVNAAVSRSRSATPSRNARSSRTPGVASQPAASETARPVKPDMAAPLETTLAVTPVREGRETITPRLAIGDEVRVGRSAPVFLYARETQTPLEVLNEGAIARVRDTQGDWYFIEFTSPRWGRRVGYVKSSVLDYREQPMDLSAPQALVPLDLSVPDQTSTPLDLSVPEQK